MSNDIQAFEKIIEEVKASSVYAETNNGYGAMCVTVGSAERIIRKHMNDGWIPVEERNPEVGQYVLGTNKYGEVMIYRYGWNSPHTRKMFFHLCGSAATIIAWRPIPEPYSTTKGDTNGKE